MNISPQFVETEPNFFLFSFQFSAKIEVLVIIDHTSDPIDIYLRKSNNIWQIFGMTPKNMIPQSLIFIVDTVDT